MIFSEEDQKNCITDMITTDRDAFTDGEEVVEDPEDISNIETFNIDNAKKETIYPCPLKFNFRQDKMLRLEINNPFNNESVSLKTKFNLFPKSKLSNHVRANIPQLLLVLSLPFHLTELGVKRFETEFKRIRNLKLKKLQENAEFQKLQENQEDSLSQKNLIFNLFKSACITKVNSANIKLRVTLNEALSPSFHAIQFELFFDWLAWMMLSYDLSKESEIEKQAKEISAKAGEILRGLIKYPMYIYSLELKEPDLEQKESNLKEGVIYLYRKLEEIYYQVYGIHSDWVGGAILDSDLPQDFPLQWKSLSEVDPFLPDILKITQLNGHTLENSFKDYLDLHPKVERSLREYLIPTYEKLLSRETGLSRFGLLKLNSQKISSDAQSFHPSFGL